ncbi:MAG: nucleoside monophosphate kinase [Planctomycetota bacterium]
MHRAILLTGPTGTGKTPLGQLLGQRGLWNSPCFHFDFGDRLRRLATGEDHVDQLSRDDIDFVIGILRTGALLEKDRFYIAEALLNALIAERKIGAEDLIVLNGLPRHVDQARKVDRLVDIELVVHLSCSAKSVLERITANVGGDRTSRPDDDEQSVRHRMRIFAARTAPLLGHYRLKGARIETIEVTPRTRPDEMWRELARRGREQSQRKEEC